MTQPRVLVADDEPLILEALCGFLDEQPWDVEAVSDGQQALERLREDKFDVAVLDIRMPHLDGLAVLNALPGLKMDTDVLILTAFGTVPRAVEAMHKGAKDFIQKPIKKEEFVKKVGSFIDARQPITTHILADRLDAFLLANLTRKDLTLGIVMDHFRLSKTYVWKLFKDMNSTFTERLAFHRVEKGKNLLMYSNEPIYVIAELCGFKNQSRFSEVFMRVVGESPTRFRQLNNQSA